MRAPLLPLMHLTPPCSPSTPPCSPSTPPCSPSHYEVIPVLPAPLASIVTSLVGILWSPDGGLSLLTADVLSMRSLTWAHNRPFAKLFTANEPANSSKQLMCSVRSIWDHNPPVLTPWHTAPSPFSKLWSRSRDRELGEKAHDHSMHLGGLTTSETLPWLRLTELLLH